MITALDTNVLLDIFAADPKYLRSSQQAVRVCLTEGKLVACDVVWAEIGAFFPSKIQAESAMTLLGVEFHFIDVKAALMASEFWKKYRKRGGARLRILPDFLIGAHALEYADRLLSRDSGFYRRYFTNLRVFDPAPLKD